MKTLSVLAIALFGTNAHAGITSLKSYEAALAGPKCIEHLGTALSAITHPSAWMTGVPIVGENVEAGANKVRSTVLRNLEIYEGAIQQVRSNLAKGYSNRPLFAKFNRSLDRQSKNILGAPIAACIRSNVNFSGVTETQQKTMAADSLKIIAQLKKAVQ
jgi:hypothetical protein